MQLTFPLNIFDSYKKAGKSKEKKDIPLCHLNINTILKFPNYFFFYNSIHTILTENINLQIYATLQALSSSIVEGDETDIEF